MTKGLLLAIQALLDSEGIAGAREGVATVSKPALETLRDIVKRQRGAYNRNWGQPSGYIGRMAN